MDSKGEEMEILDSNTNRKARKEHSCDWCDGVIKKGEHYDWQKLVSDDHGIYEWKAHKHCVAVASEYNMFDDWEDGLSQGSFADRVFDIYSEEHDIDKELDLADQVLRLYGKIEEDK